jgi:hypothetical protein
MCNCQLLLQDLPREVLEGMYARLRAGEIRMDEGDMYESEVVTFVAPKQSGWLKKKSNGVFAGWKVSASLGSFAPCVTAAAALPTCVSIRGRTLQSARLSICMCASAAVV